MFWNNLINKCEWISQWEINNLFYNNGLKTADMVNGNTSGSSIHTRIMSASLGSIITTLFVTPMDTMKVRQQMKNLSGRTVIRDIYKNEGLFAFWKGFTPTILMSIPANVIYYVSYDYLKDYLNQSFSIATSSLIAGATARSTVVMLGSPFELLRTRLQAEKKLTGVTTWKVLIKEAKVDFRMLFRGAVPTLYRDIPFSAIYWSLYEVINPDKSNFWNNFTCGCISGIVAATATIPFDVAKTRRQVSHDSIGMITLMRTMVKNEGISVLYSGLLPRLAKVAPACGIMIATYEFGKTF